MKNTRNGWFRYRVYTVIMAGILSLSARMASGQITVTGTVSDKSTGTTLPGAHVVSKTGNQKTVTDPEGKFKIKNLSPGEIELKVSYLGYSTGSAKMILKKDTTIFFHLDGAALLGEEVNIIATRAQEKYPTPFTSVSGITLQSINLGKDIPYLIQQTPSVVVTSDAGNGIGYSGMNIRGTDLTRINVTINGIPLNDAESQGVWFVDLPDLASSAGDIQIQRGVGTSTNGAGAFGASVNLKTTDLHQDPYGEMSLSGGSFNTFKSTLKFGTGLMSGKFSVDGRLSFIRSDGYIDRASSNLKSYYFSAGYYGKATTLKLITFSGIESTYQAWNGVPKDSLNTNRTYNPSGQYIDLNGNTVYYNNQTDNYQQDHYQLILSRKITKKLNLNFALHYTHGSGYYENYKQDESLADYELPPVIFGTDTVYSTDLVNRKMMDNNFMGLTFSTVYSIPDKIQVILGGAWNRYRGDHFGKVIWAQYASTGSNDRNWYYNEGDKRDFNLYVKANYNFNKILNVFADLQYRGVDYKMSGTLDNLRPLDQNHHFNFFNPKAGVYLSVTKRNELYCSFGIANREPSRNNYKDADPGKTPTNETLFDTEIGYAFKSQPVSFTANIYHMNYRNQLVLTGEINNVGEAVMVNVPSSYRMGIELSAVADLIKDKLQWSVTTTLSRNRIRDFVQYIDLYDPDWNYLGQQKIEAGETDLSFSPAFTASGILTAKPLKGFSVALNSKYVGKQYIDNTSSTDRMLNGYFVHGLNLSWSIETKLVREIAFNVTINNLFSYKYESNAWVYPYLIGNQYYEYNGYFPQALINFLAGITVRL